MVERREILVEIDLHPLASGLLRVARGDADKLDAYALSLVIRADLRVDQERVVTAVPRNVHEPDERSVDGPRGHPAEAVRTDSVPPPRLRCAAVGSREGDELVVGYLGAPCEPEVCQYAAFAQIASARFSFATHAALYDATGTARGQSLLVGARPARPLPGGTIGRVQVRGIHHLGVAVADLDEAVETWERLFGASVEHRDSLESQGVDAVSLRVGDSRIELLMPTGEDTPVGRFLARRGSGMHHVALATDDINGALRDLDAAGAQLIDHIPRRGLYGLEVAFVHPDAVHGVLTEVVSTD